MQESFIPFFNIRHLPFFMENMSVVIQPNSYTKCGFVISNQITASSLEHFKKKVHALVTFDCLNHLYILHSTKHLITALIRTN
jgi:hypothetical protein